MINIQIRKQQKTHKGQNCRAQLNRLQNSESTTINSYIIIEVGAESHKKVKRHEDKSTETERHPIYALAKRDQR